MESLLQCADSFTNLTNFTYTERDNLYNWDPLKNLHVLKQLKSINFLFNVSSVNQNFAAIFGMLSIPFSVTKLSLNFHNINPDIIETPLKSLDQLDSLKKYQQLEKFSLKLSLNRIVSARIQNEYLLSIKRVLQNLTHEIQELSLDLPNFSLEEEYNYLEINRISDQIFQCPKLISLEVRMPINYQQFKGNFLSPASPLANLCILNIREFINFSEGLFKRLLRQVQDLTFIPGRPYESQELVAVLRNVRLLSNLKKFEIIVSLKSKPIVNKFLVEEVEEIITSFPALNSLHVSISNISVNEA